MIILKAWAKINIGLNIMNKREDGYHNIKTTLTTINLSDIIQMEETDSQIQIESKDFDEAQKENLCFKAAQLFEEQFSVRRGVRIKLVKNIPVGGGLGGGSSDAACVLKGMNKLFGVGASDESLVKLAGTLGADVPFFIKGGAAYARGIGDELNFFKLPKMKLIVYYPGYPISTKWAYEEYDKTLLTNTPQPDTITKEQKGKKKKRRIDFKIENDFEKVVFKKHPDLLDVKTNLIATGAFFVSLSGSGSCLFTLIDDQIHSKIVKYLDSIGAQYFEVSTI